jgi:hypothetical protein
MSKAEFDRVAQQIANIYWNQGDDAALQECDRVNAPEKFSVRFQGLKGGPYLAFFFHDTRSGKELYRTTIWNLRKAIGARH